MFNQEEFIALIDKVSACNNSPMVIIYDYLPDQEKKNIRIENGEEIYMGVKVIRLKTISID